PSATRPSCRGRDDLDRHRRLCVVAALAFVFGTSGCRMPRDEAPYLVKDIHAGAGSSEPGGFTRLGNVVIFAASDTEHGRELWRTDGTPQGTSLLMDIDPGPASLAGAGS